MLVKSQVKYIQNLGHKKFRDADGVFVAEGPKIVNELLGSDIVQLVQCFATENWLIAQENFVKGKERLFLKIDEEELRRISFHDSPNQVLATIIGLALAASIQQNAFRLILPNLLPTPGQV